MKVIYNYPVEVQSEFSLDIPENAEVLCVQTQHDNPYIWVLLDTSDDSIERNFSVVPTGQEILWTDKQARYIGTFQLSDGFFIGHLFELK